MKFGKPLIYKNKYFKDVEKEINKLFYEIIYRPIISAIEYPKEKKIKIKFSEIFNAIDPLEIAVRNGDVYFEDGRFQGSFNSRISRQLRAIGAKYNRKSKSWSFSGAMPSNIQIAMASADARYSSIKDRLINVLDNIDTDKINEISDIPDVYDKTIDEMEKDFQKSMKSISIPAKLTEAQKGILTAEWGYNLDLYIKKWADKNILDLRKKVQDNAFSGKRSTALIEGMQKNYGVSKRKAKFLARQETSLLMSKFREIRYKDLGSTEYKWSGSMDERERHDHKILEGRIFSWDDPPITNRKTGAKNHPGEDFGCRCIAIPIIPNE